MRILHISILALFTSGIFAQQPTQTVVFKVRKAKQEVISDTVIAVVVPARENEEPVFQIVEEPASFQGGDVNTFRIWVQSNIAYPQEAIDAKISGKVVVQFAVDSKGKVVDAMVLRGVTPSLDKETVKVVNMSPVWTPGKQRGKRVKQQFVIPVIFQLQ